MQINLKNKDTGAVKQIKVGASWTTLFFGFWVPLIRGDWKFFLIFAVVQLLGLSTFGIVTLIACIVGCAKYNYWYASELIKDGYRPNDNTAKEVLRNNNLYSMD